MELYNAISKDSIIHEVWRICGANANTYTLRDIIARVNSALDRFCHLAFQSDGRWSFDDINESSPPLDKQNIVSGTNRYKFGSFTEKIINLIKLEALDADANGIELLPESFDSLGSGAVGFGDSSRTFQELYIDASSGTPYRYCKYGDFVYLRDNPNYSETDGLVAYFNRPASKFDFNTFTVTIDAPGVFTLAAHGFAINDTVMLETDGALPTGLAVDTVYYVVATVATNTFSVSATKGGTAITTSGSQSGVHYLVQTSKVPGIAEIYQPYLAKYASLPFLIEKSLPQVGAVASQIQIDEKAIEDYFTRRDKDTRNILKPRITSFR